MDNGISAILHKMVGLMYELFAAVRTTVVLGQNLVGLITQEVTAMGTCIVALELAAQHLPLLGHA